MKKTEFESQVLILIGEVKAIGETNQDQISKLFSVFEVVRDSISKLPCDANIKRLGDLEFWTKGHNSEQKDAVGESRRGRTNLKIGLIIAFTGFGCSIVGSGLTLLIQRLLS